MPITFSPDLLARRLSALQLKLAEQDIDLAVLHYATDLYYYTGSVQPLYLLVPQVGTPAVVARKALARIAAEVPHLPLFDFTGSHELAAILARVGGTAVRRVGFTLDTIAYASVQRLHRLLPGAAIVDLAWEIRTLRMVKAPEELAILARAGAIMTQVPALVRAHFHPGITELALSAALEHAFRLNGHDALIRCRREGVEMSGCGVCATGVHSLAGTKFDGICGGTGLSPAVPYGAADAPIPQGAPILLDFAFVLAGYHLDQTRMACWGTPAEPVRAAYAAMLEVQAAIFAAMRPGAVWETIYQEAVAQAAALGYAEVFMGAGRERVKFVGHGVGLELDEPPFLAPQMPYPLAEGMALAIEPKVALPGVGVVGIEDTVVVRAAGVERLTPCSQEWIVVE